MKYIYITGRGHSGSTVIDAMIGNSDSVESVGELVSGMGRLEDICSCGEKMEDCGFWTTVRKSFEHKSGKSWDHFVTETHNIAHVKKFLKTLTTNSQSNKELSDLTKIFTQTLLDVAGKTAILDSSKTPNRALFLSKFYPDSKIIHLVKHPDGVVASRFSRMQKGQGYRFLRRKFSNPKLIPLYTSVEALSWLSGNALIEVIKLIKPSKVMLLRYEDLGKQPEIVFERLSEFLEIELAEVLDAVLTSKELTFGHNIGGNGVRHRSSFIFDTNQGQDKKRLLPKMYKVLVRIFCWPLMWRYGYNVFSI